MSTVSHPTDRHNFTIVSTPATDLYFSYSTLVAFRTDKTGLVCSENVWTVTTGKHLNYVQPDKKARVKYAEFERLARENNLL